MIPSTVTWKFLLRFKFDSSYKTNKNTQAKYLRINYKI